MRLKLPVHDPSLPIVTPDAEMQQRLADFAEAGIIGAPVDNAEI